MIWFCPLLIIALATAVAPSAPPTDPERDSLIYEGGFYPRAVELADGTLLVAFDYTAAGRRALGCVRSRDGGRTWSGYTRIVDATGRVDLSNAFPLQLPDGTILVACRHHWPEEHSFNLEVYASEDQGQTWRLRSVAVHGNVGLWEPFLFQPAPQTLQVYYASEEGIFPDQRIEMRTSRDGGRTWGAPTTVARKPGSRDGMPAVVRMPSGDLLAAFEASDTPPFGFVIRTVRSRDDGANWSTERALVYQPENPARERWSAGAPYLVCLPDGRLLVSFQTDEDVEYLEGDTRRDPRQRRYTYTHHTALKFVRSDDHGRTWSRPLKLAGGPERPTNWSGLIALRDGRTFALAGIGGQLWWKPLPHMDRTSTAPAAMSSP